MKLTPAQARTIVYAAASIASLIAAYLLTKHVIGQDEVTLEAGIVSVVLGLAGFKAMNPDAPSVPIAEPTPDPIVTTVGSLGPNTPLADDPAPVAQDGTVVNPDAAPEVATLLPATLRAPAKKAAARRAPAKKNSSAPTT
ncbi:hypothetical protein Back2_18060 [Nocardioides baekrokdamisoli]|uniref:Uncharacterized protein n=1 Tax=Nocardioides baekrokdamisoli TaxID=1804624 RepID=A0A3G9J3D6_9ACTN|nr:hypothetical protein [Nocardioides baekrokdamisoli]BBH17519.1 hypothetical protein Back2_18060 [Nocardioides baekrokdamisoli]